MADPHRIVIVGAGFGGLEAVHRLAGTPVKITLIDRRNHHLFQPLLYQVATASLATSEIAWPIRHLLRNRPEVTTLLATVTGVDASARRVLLEGGDSSPYDTLILATGARHAYFGHDEWEPYAPGLKTLEDGTTIRRRLLLAFAVELLDDRGDFDNAHEAPDVLALALPCGVLADGNVFGFQHRRKKIFRQFDPFQKVGAQCNELLAHGLQLVHVAFLLAFADKIAV